MGNELTEQFQNPKLGKEIYDIMQNFTHNYEPTRKVTAAMNLGGSEQPWLFSMNVVSYNYSINDFVKWAALDTNLIFISTETLPYSILSKQLLSEELPRTDTVDFSKNSWFYNKENYVGQFIWAGFDYLGESKGWPDRGCPVGLVTTSGIRKPYSYFTESIYSDNPMVHLAVYDSAEAARLEAIRHFHRFWYGPPVASHWNWNNDSAKPIPVYAFSNTDSVQLFLNNQYIGTSIPSTNADKVARFYVKFIPGTLKALGYKNGTVVAVHQLQTAGKPEKITIISENPVIIPNGSDISILRVSIKDRNGTICPFAKNEIQFKITGVGELAGIDNGDISQHFNYKNKTLPAVNGQCMAVVRSNGQAGEIIIEARAKGLKPVRITLFAKY
jgi:beta-galactosidase